MRASALLTVAVLGIFTAPAMSLAQGGSTAAKTSAKDDPNRLICRSTRDTGSLARRTRQCYTRAEWDRLAEQQRANSLGATAFSGGSSSSN